MMAVPFYSFQEALMALKKRFVAAVWTGLLALSGPWRISIVRTSSSGSISQGRIVAKVDRRLNSRQFDRKRPPTVTHQARVEPKRSRDQRTHRQSSRRRRPRAAARASWRNATATRLMQRPATARPGRANPAASATAAMT
jgi:hypothetical protein